MNKFVSSALAGAAATGPMTLLMTFLHERLPEEKRKYLSPREIDEKLLEKFHLGDDLDESEMEILTLISHFSYGTLAGSLFSLWPEKKGKIFQGMAHGLCVWAFSYNVLLPLLGLKEPSFKQTRDENVLLISTHLLWGTALALAQDLLERKDKLSGFTESSKGDYSVSTLTS